MERSTRAVWTERVARLKESGLTAKEFALQIGVNPRSLAWWRWQLGSKPRAAVPKRALARRSSPSLAKTPTPLSPLTFVEMTSTVET